MAPPTEELLTKAIYPSLCTSSHAEAQNNTSLFLSALFYSLTHSGRQHKQRRQMKGKRWQLRLAQRPSRLTWETCCVQGKREKNHQTAEEKAEIFKLSAHPHSISCCFPLNCLLISLSCELPVPQLCLVLLSLITQGPRLMVTMFICLVEVFYTLNICIHRMF